MKIYAGTSGYSYKEWKGTFYPEDLAAAKMLAHYATRLPAVEINNSFYRVPKRNVVESWRDEVPSEFRFALKATRRITHVKRLKNAGDELEYMLEQFGAMEERLGTVLFQMPPTLKQDLDRLEAFLALLPTETRAAFEFRHPSWNDEATFTLLRARNCALVVTDSDDSPGDSDEDGSSPSLVRTADWTYLRLRREAYTDEQLTAWVDRLAETGFEEVFAFFKHEEAGAGPRIAARFLQLLG